MDFFFSMRLSSPRPHTLIFPPLDSPAVVIIVLPSYWHSITSTWNRSRSICKFLVSSMLNVLQTNWLCKQPLCLNYWDRKWFIVVSSTLFANERTEIADIIILCHNTWQGASTTYLTSLKLGDVVTTSFTIYLNANEITFHEFMFSTFVP